LQDFSTNFRGNAITWPSSPPQLTPIVRGTSPRYRRPLPIRVRRCSHPVTDRAARQRWLRDDVGTKPEPGLTGGTTYIVVEQETIRVWRLVADGAPFGWRAKAHPICL